MKGHLLLLPVLFLFSVSSAQQPPGWKLVWSDEFNYAGIPDTAKWAYDEGGTGWGNDELEYYTGRSNNCRVEDSCLVIEARKETMGPNAYTSARLVTRGKAAWTHGRVEVRAKLPAGRGTWPAVWLLGGGPQWPDEGEIDIMEHLGYDPGIIHATIHCAKYNHMLGNAKSANTVVPDCSMAFHVYGVEWDSDSVCVFVDDTKYFTYRNEHTGNAAWPFDGPLYLLLNIAIGGSWGGVKGVDDAIFPQRMVVDYVRVFQK